MQFIDDQIIEIGKEVRKTITIVIGQKSGINHIGIGENDVGFLSNAAALGAWCIPIVNACLYAVLPEILHKVYDITQLIFG